MKFQKKSVLEKLIPADHPYKVLKKKTIGKHAFWEIPEVENFGSVQLTNCLIIKYTEGLSDFQLARYIQESVVCRWFCNFDFDDSTPDMLTIKYVCSLISSETINLIEQFVKENWNPSDSLFDTVLETNSTVESWTNLTNFKNELNTTILSNVQSHIIVFAVEPTSLIFYSEYAHSISGFSAQEVSTMQIDEVFEFNQYDNFCIEHIIKDETFEIVAKLKCKNSFPLPVELKSIALRDSNDHIYAVLITSTIIPSEENVQLHARQSFLNSLIESIPCILYTFDHFGLLTKSNKHAVNFEQKVFMSSPSIGTSIDEIFVDYAVISQNFRVILKKKKQVQFNINICKSGLNHWLDIIMTPIFNLQNRLEGVMLIGFDVSKRVQSEKNYETVIAELKLAKEQSEALCKKNNLFISKISHELRTPLNVISGFSGLAIRSDNNEFVQNCMQKISLSVNHSLAILNDILSFMSNEASESELNDSLIVMDDFFNKLKSLVELDAAAQQISVEFNIDKNVQDAYIGAELRITQIFINLINNAIKYSNPNGYVKISVCEGNTVANNKQLICSVSDNGIGIPTEHLTDIFEMYLQVDKRTSSKLSGVGIGLAIVKNIIEHLGGTIRVKSTLGVGTDFTFDFMLKEANDSIQFNNMNTEITQNDELSWADIMLVNTDMELHSLLFNIKHIEYSSIIHALNKLIALSNSEEALNNIIIIDLDATVREDCLNMLNGLNSIKGWNGKVIITSENSNIAMPKDVYFLRKPYAKIVLLELLNRIKQDLKKEIYFDFNGKTILIAEDIDINQDLLQHLLKNTNIKILQAYNGIEAVSMIKENIVDIILMDIQMPVINGYQASMQIREFNKDIPIIAISANVFKDDVSKAENAGMNTHICKPIDEFLLKFEIARLLQLCLPKMQPATVAPVAAKNVEFDLNDGLNRALGNQTLYNSLVVHLFNGERMDNCIVSYQNQDWDALTMHLHTLKGVTSNLGFHALSQLSGKLNKAVLDDGVLNAKYQQDFDLLVKKYNGFRDDIPKVPAAEE